MSQQIFNQALTSGVSVTVSSPYWGGVDEFINYSPLQLNINGGSGFFTLGPNQRVGVASMPNGTSYNIVPAALSALPSSISYILEVNHYERKELDPYPPTEISTPPSNATVGSTNVPVWAVDVSVLGNSNDGGTTAPAGQRVRVLGFDFTGDINATSHTGTIVISGLIEPLSGNTYNDMHWYINQGPNGTQQLFVRFPVVLVTSLKGTVTFSWSGINANARLIEYYQIY